MSLAKLLGDEEPEKIHMPKQTHPALPETNPPKLYAPPSQNTYGKTYAENNKTSDGIGKRIGKIGFYAISPVFFIPTGIRKTSSLGALSLYVLGSGIANGFLYSELWGSSWLPAFLLIQGISNSLSLSCEIIGSTDGEKDDI